MEDEPRGGTPPGGSLPTWHTPPPDELGEAAIADLHDLNPWNAAGRLVAEFLMRTRGEPLTAETIAATSSTATAATTGDIEARLRLLAELEDLAARPDAFGARAQIILGALRCFLTAPDPPTIWQQIRDLLVEHGNPSPAINIIVEGAAKWVPDAVRMLVGALRAVDAAAVNLAPGWHPPRVLPMGVLDRAARARALLMRLRHEPARAAHGSTGTRYAAARRAREIAEHFTKMAADLDDPRIDAENIAPVEEAARRAWVQLLRGNAHDGFPRIARMLLVGAIAEAATNYQANGGSLAAAAYGAHTQFAEDIPEHAADLTPHDFQAPIHAWRKHGMWPSVFTLAERAGIAGKIDSIEAE